MAITKLSHVKERKSGNPNAGLYNCIDYILNPDKTEERYIGGNAGSTTQEVYNRMMATKQEFRKLDGRQCYHFIISFAPGEKRLIEICVTCKPCKIIKFEPFRICPPAWMN